jgi:hypothetical protein
MDALDITGKTVVVHDSPYAEQDCLIPAWPSLRGKEGVVRGISGVPPRSNYAVEFPFDFPGGHECHGHVPSKRGQWFTYGTFDLVRDGARSENWADCTKVAV